MPRNLRHRVEVLFPVEEPALRDRLRGEVLGAYLADRVKARRILPDGTHERVTAAPGEPVASAQLMLLELAAKSAARYGEADSSEPLPAVAADATTPSARRQRRARKRVDAT